MTDDELDLIPVQYMPGASDSPPPDRVNVLTPVLVVAIVLDSWKQDARLLQQKSLVSDLQVRFNSANALAAAAEVQRNQLDAQQTALGQVRDAASAKVGGLRDEYEVLRDRINAQYVVLKALSQFAIEVLTASRPNEPQPPSAVRPDSAT